MEFREHLAEDWVLSVRRQQRSHFRVGGLWMYEMLICELIVPLQDELSLQELQALTVGQLYSNWDTDAALGRGLLGIVQGRGNTTQHI